MQSKCRTKSLDTTQTNIWACQKKVFKLLLNWLYRHKYWVPSNTWTYCARWHRYPVSIIETNVFEISCLPCMFFFINLYVTIWYKNNKLIIYLYDINTKFNFAQKVPAVVSHAGNYVYLSNKDQNYVFETMSRRPCFRFT